MRIANTVEDAARENAARLGGVEWSTRYEDMLGDPEVEAVVVASPTPLHAEMAAAAGKHVFCEKPISLELERTRQVVEAVRVAGVKLQDWLLDPATPMTRRLRKETGGVGPLADLGSHLVDLAHFLVGSIAEVVGTAETFIKERPREEGVNGANPRVDRVTVNDVAAFLARFENGAIGTFEVSPLVPGRKAKESFEVNGSKGSLFFDLERVNELQVYPEDEEPETSGFRTLLVTEPQHPYMAGWWPPGHILGYEHTFVHTVKDLLDGIKTGESPGPTFEDGYRCQLVIDAVERSVERRGWAAPETYGAKGGANGEA
jgi:predicted dehydrogenase